MKRINLKNILFLLMGFTLFLTSCGKMPINGDLDGQWQILAIQYTDGRVENPERAYYCVQLHTITLRQVNGPNRTGNMTYEGDQLSFVMPTSTVDQLRVFGLNDTQETFTVTELTSNRLVLTSDYAQITFRKF